MAAVTRTHAPVFRHPLAIFALSPPQGGEIARPQDEAQESWQQSAVADAPLDAAVPSVARLPVRAGARLGPADWVMAGFGALVEKGPDAIRVEALARDLAATKGSFYWHFRDLLALKTAMLAAWEVLGTSAITTAVRRPGLDAMARIHLLVDLLSLPSDDADGPGVEPAIRDWARSDPQARAVLARVDQHRIADLTALIAGTGCDPASADQAARIFYAALIGLENLRITTATPIERPLRAVAEALMMPRP